uniref:Tenascin C n=1 Tax=Kryptolebias marmoratus TaxID=37003 RepID=A0A3Q2ZT11_KRYMA
MGRHRLLGSLCLIVLISLTNARFVEKLLRHRRQTLSPPKEHNVTIPGAGHPVVFSHVYNINVPASSLCSVDLDAPESTQPHSKDVAAGHHVTKHTLNGENQIIFTHRINIPQQACGCTQDLPGLKELQSRLEMLEGEVSALRDQCSSAQVSGDVGTKPYCNGHGNYSAETCGCICDPGWRGTNCTKPDCPSSCQHRGSCVDGNCECLKGFTGEDCGIKSCPVDCGAHGHCVDGVCICSDGFFGKDCSQSRCLNNCLGRGHCEDGDCVCDESWTGFDCSELICPNDCYDRGHCVNGTCYCEKGFSGGDCGQRTCPNNCRGNGFCVDGKCICSAGYSGEDCSQLTCLNDCNGRGTCFNGMCICDSGYQGEDCSQLACLNNCNSRGQCINGQCSCDVGFQGDDCSELSCPRNCQLRGRCVNGQCVCDEGYAGEDCSIRICPSNCYARGECIEGHCVCHAGFAGEDCSDLSCPNNCRNRGRCIDGQCVCDEGFSGEDCSQRACPNDCLAQGRCHEGKCICQEGYTGEDCSVLACPDNCNKRGRCVNGRCTCESGYEGESCAELSCLNSCQDRGRCVNGQCVCDEGYIGEDCLEVSPPKDLKVGEVSTDTVDLSWNNEMLVTEYLVTYVPTSPGGLLMEFTVPGDKTAATVKELEPGIEYLINVYAVLSNKKSIPVSARVATELPQPEGLRFKSVKETSVEVMWDQLDISFDAWEIHFRNTVSLPYFQSGLGPGQEYEVSINIIKNNTRGPQTSKTVTTKIDGPQQVEVKFVTDSSALISWYLPVAPMDRVTMLYMPTSDSLDQTTVDISPPDKQYSIDSLRPDTEYSVSIISRRGNTSSDPVTTTFTTALDAPTGLQAVSQTDNSITLEWTNSQADAGSYRVKFSPISGATHGEKVFPRGLGHKTQATITGLKPGAEYGIGVTAVKNERESLPATTNAATGEQLKVKSTQTSLTLRWQKPQAKVGRYRLVYVSREGEAEEVEIPVTETTYILSNLIPGMSYTFSLTAERGHRRSRPVSLSASTGECPEDEQGTLTVSRIKSDVFDISWKLNAHSSLQDMGEVRLPGDAHGSRITGLKASTEYQIKLFGITSSQRPALLEAVAVTGITPTTQSALENENPDPLLPITNETFSTSDVSGMSSGAEPEGSDKQFRNLSVSVTTTSVSLAWSAPDEVFDSFLVELTAPSAAAQPHVTQLPGSRRTAETDGLSPSTLYDVTLQGLVEGRPSLPLSSFVTTAELKPTIDNLSISDIAWNGFTASWNPTTEDFDSFVIEVTNMENSAESQNLTLSGDALSLGISGLIPNTSYMVGLYGIHQGSFLEPLYIEATTVTQPVVGKLYVSNVTSESFTIHWNDTERQFDGFILEIIDSDWLTEPKEYNISHNVTSLDVTGLRPSTHYVAYLYGTYKGSQTSALSIVASTGILTLLENLTISDVTPYGFRVSWEVSGGFSHFHIVVTDSGWLLQPQKFTVPGNQDHLNIWGLITGIGYEVKLTGVSESGLLSRPLTTVAVTEAEPELEHLFISDITADSFRLSWAADEDLFDTFVIKVRDSKRLAHPQEYSVRGNKRTKVVTGLMSGTEYEIELYGITADQRSQPITGSPRGLHFSEVTDSTAIVHWSNPRFTVDNYRITYVPFEGGSPLIVTADGSVSETLLVNMVPGKGYQVTVSALKGLEESEPSTGSVTTALDSPRGVTAVNVTDTSALLLWQPSVATVHHYVITYMSPMVEHISGNTVEFEMNSLVPGSHYTVGVYGMKEAQKSPSAITEFTTDVDPPRDLTAVNIQTDSATLTWKPPHASVTGYMLTFSSADGVIRVCISSNVIQFTTYQEVLEHFMLVIL